MTLTEVLSLPDGTAKTAALVAWVQGLYGAGEEQPVLVGGAVVELLTGARLDLAKLRRLVKRREVAMAWKSLRTFARRFESRDPTPEELAAWADRVDS